MNNEYGDFDKISDTYMKGRVKYARFKCRKCGLEKDTQYYRMKEGSNGSNNHNKSCTRRNEIEKRKINVNSNDFGEFILLEDLGYRSEKDHHRVGLFKCNVCGREKKVNINAMATGIGNSHMHCINDSNVKFTKQFKSEFNAMKNRCNNPDNDRYNRYGGRGITCDYEYLIDFYDDFYYMYLRHVTNRGESETTIDRIDINKGYTKDNIKFATYKEQARNKSTNRGIKIIDRSNNYEYYFNSIAAGVEYLHVPRTNVDGALARSGNFGDGRYSCEYYDKDNIKPIIQLIKSKPLIEFY